MSYDHPRQEGSTAGLPRASDAAMEMRSLFELIYPEARAIAAAHLRRERLDHTLQPTALVHEAYLRLVNSRQRWRGADDMLPAVARTIRRVLIDHARVHNARKRGRRGCPSGLWAVRPMEQRWPDDALDLDQCLARFQAVDPRRAQVAELKVFAGLGNEQVALVLGIARSTVAEDWSVARAWLSRALSERQCHGRSEA